MRRKEKEISDRSELEEIIRLARILRLGLWDGRECYIVPVNFGYREGQFYFHSAQSGRKTTILKKEGIISFELEADLQVVPAEQACQWGMAYRSVMGTGQVRLLQTDQEKRQGLDRIMENYSQDKSFEYSPEQINAVDLYTIRVLSLTGKKSGII